MMAGSTGRSSHIFRFKHFAVSNTASAQKVGTDGVLTGAWASAPSPRVIWDAGAGTGLIALMLAQRYSGARIVAVEIDSIAAAECLANVGSSPWRDRVTVAGGDVMALAPQLPVPDLIVSNPPFFDTSGAVSPDRRRALARHDGSLSPSALISVASLHLAPGGRLVFIAPSSRNEDVMLCGEIGRMTPVATLDVCSRGDREPIRRIWTFMRRGEADRAVTEAGRIAIRTGGEGNPFSDEYRALTRDFYLDF